MNNEMFSDRLRTVMKEQCLSQSDLSRMSSIGKSNISQYISGINRPRAAAIKRLSSVLNVPAGWLTGDIDETETSLSVIYAAKALGVMPQRLRCDLQQRRLPFGYAANKNGRFRYFISPTKFEEYLSMKGRNAQ